jgi:serine/threonine protein kinase
MAKTQIGTPYYVSPELWKNKPYNAKSDIWALGCLLYEMITGKPPFDSNDMRGLARKVSARRPLLRASPHAPKPDPLSRAGHAWRLPASVVALLTGHQGRDCEVARGEPVPPSLCGRHPQDATGACAGHGLLPRQWRHDGPQCRRERKIVLDWAPLKP